MSATTATPRDSWLASARAIGEHVRLCKTCGQKPLVGCATYDAFWGAERAAWDALNDAPRPDAARAGHAGRGGLG